MDIYQSALDEILSLSIIAEWPTAQELMGRAARRQPKNWQLPGLAGRAVGGRSEQVGPPTAAVAAMHVSILLIDDLLDADPRGEHHRIGVGAAANTAAALQAAAVEIILKCEWVSPGARLAATRSLNNLALTTCFGQYLDMLNPADEESYWRVVRLKSSPLFATSFELGALFGGGSPVVVGQLKRLGEIYGEIMQIHDDLKDTLATPANPDWLLGRSPLPILFAETVPHPQSLNSALFVKHLHEANQNQTLIGAELTAASLPLAYSRATIALDPDLVTQQFAQPNLRQATAGRQRVFAREAIEPKQLAEFVHRSSHPARV